MISWVVSRLMFFKSWEIKISSCLPKHGLLLWKCFFSSVPSSLPRTTPNYLHHPQIICPIQILLISVWLTQQTHVFWFAQSCSKRRNIYNYLNNWWWVISYSRPEFVECTHYIRTLMNIWIVLASEDATFSVCI